MNRVLTFYRLDEGQKKELTCDCAVCRKTDNMALSPRHILSGIALVLCVCAIIWPNNLLYAVAGILLAVCNFLP